MMGGASRLPEQRTRQRIDEMLVAARVGGAGLPDCQPVRRPELPVMLMSPRHGTWRQ